MPSHTRISFIKTETAFLRLRISFLSLSENRQTASGLKTKLGLWRKSPCCTKVSFFLENKVWTEDRSKKSSLCNTGFHLGMNQNHNIYHEVLLNLRCYFAPDAVWSDAQTTSPGSYQLEVRIHPSIHFRVGCWSVIGAHVVINREILVLSVTS